MVGRVESYKTSALTPSSIHPIAWNKNSANFAFWGFSEVCSAPVVAARILASQTQEGEILSGTHHNLWGARHRRDMPPLPWRARVGGAPRASSDAPATQRCCGLHLRGFGRDLRRAAGPRGYRRLAELSGGR